MTTFYTYPEPTPTEETEREIPFLKGYTVFNAEQCEGLPVQYSAKVEAPALPPLARIERAEMPQIVHPGSLFRQMARRSANAVCSALGACAESW